jgi:hypothetical protein
MYLDCVVSRGLTQWQHLREEVRYLLNTTLA